MTEAADQAGPQDAQARVVGSAHRAMREAAARDAPAACRPIGVIVTQADGADSQRGRGLGIGLALVKEIASLHRGTVEVKSEGKGKGSEFIVRVPLARPPEID